MQLDGLSADPCNFTLFLRHFHPVHINFSLIQMIEQGSTAGCPFGVRHWSFFSMAILLAGLISASASVKVLSDPPQPGTYSAPGEWRDFQVDNSAGQGNNPYYTITGGVILENCAFTNFKQGPSTILQVSDSSTVLVKGTRFSDLSGTQPFLLMKTIDVLQVVDATFEVITIPYCGISETDMPDGKVQFSNVTFRGRNHLTMVGDR
jgi:hypothetical protein